MVHCEIFDTPDARREDPKILSYGTVRWIGNNDLNVVCEINCRPTFVSTQWMFTAIRRYPAA